MKIAFLFPGQGSQYVPRGQWIYGASGSLYGRTVVFPSDNAVFARAGVPAHTVSTTRIDVDSVYHTVDDEFDRIDPAHLAEIVRGVSTGLRGVVGGLKTPSRIPVD